MLARAQFRLFVILAALTFACLPVSAQMNGVPASVTSFGFGGRETATPGVRASVTSLGPNGYGNNFSFLGNCCSNIFLPSHLNSVAASGRHHRRKDRSEVPVGVLEPAYVPYAVPYAEGEDDAVDDGAEEDAAASYIEPGNAERRNDMRPTPTRSSGRTANPAVAQAPVTAQPSTVLIFKDGHQSDVLNYAILGETLFDISSERTHKIQLADLDLTATQKANDDRGVDFEIPASAALQ
jgi:hypothetical protein